VQPCTGPCSHWLPTVKGWLGPWTRHTGHSRQTCRGPVSIREDSVSSSLVTEHTSTAYAWTLALCLMQVATFITGGLAALCCVSWNYFRLCEDWSWTNKGHVFTWVDITHGQRRFAVKMPGAHLLRTSEPHWHWHWFSPSTSVSPASNCCTAITIFNPRLLQ
jgi:hypothetical protein